MRIILKIKKLLLANNTIIIIDVVEVRSRHKYNFDSTSLLYDYLIHSMIFIVFGHR